MGCQTLVKNLTNDLIRDVIMKPSLFWVLDRITLVLALLYVITNMKLPTYEKCILLAIIGNIVVLKDIFNVLQDGFKRLGNHKGKVWEA